MLREIFNEYRDKFAAINTVKHEIPLLKDRPTVCMCDHTEFLTL